MTKKILIAVVLFVVLAAVLSGVVWGVQKKWAVQMQQQQAQVEQKAQIIEKIEVEEKNNLEAGEINPEDWEALTLNTSDWKTYTNKNWGYSIKYPADFFINDTPIGDEYPGDDCPLICGNGGRSLIISDIEEMGTSDVMQDEKIHIVISSRKKQEGQTFDAHMKNWTEQPAPGAIYSNLTVDKRRAFLRTQENKRYIGVNIENGDWFYDIYGENHTSNMYNLDQNYEIIENIIKSFLFLD